MSKCIDYSKWDNLQDEDLVQEPLRHISSITIDVLGGLKLEADSLFRTAEASGDPYDYKIALNQGYMIVLSELTTLNSAAEIGIDAVQQLEVSCKLNSSCCNLKLMQLDQAVSVCSDVLINYDHILTRDQILRARYLRSHAYFRLGSAENFMLAEADAVCMADILKVYGTNTGNCATEYRQHFQTLKAERLRLDRIDDKIKLESECHELRNDDYLRTKEGWCLYVEMKYALSSRWFGIQLKIQTQEAIGKMPAKSSLLQTLYLGLAKSELALNRHLEVSKYSCRGMRLSVSLCNFL